jgi:hypothetical protein
LVVKGGSRRRGVEGYDDDPGSHYSWDTTVPNRENVRPGDALVLWDSRTLLGASVIERIETGSTTKIIGKCRGCGRSNFEPRLTMKPKYRCYQCKAEFDDPVTSEVEVTTYRTDHSTRWVDLAGALSGDQLRAVCVRPRSQLSIRPLHWSQFELTLRSIRPDLPLTAMNTAGSLPISGGHKKATVRVRVGQADFRRSLLDQYGDVCAFTGRSPVAALEAAHLYSFAAEGKHHDDGGFLLRRDLHRLFDLGLIALDPRTHRLDVAELLHGYPQYHSLHGEALHVQLSGGQERFLRRHWEQHRTGEAEEGI